MVTWLRRGLAVLATAAGCAHHRPPHRSPSKTKISVSSLTLPVFNPIVWNIMKARGLDAKNGFRA